MTTATESIAHRALEGVRVLDLTHQIAGPSATLVLALLGADVVKVVQHADGELDPGAFWLNNASKRSIALDLKTPEGHRTVLELARKADVLVENFGPGVIDRLGLDYETVSTVNPAIVFGQIKGFSPDSAYADYPCFDPIAQAYSGSSSITGEPDGLPQKPGPDLADTGTGMILVSAILAALFQRERTGKGQHLQIAMTDQIATFLRIHYTWPLMQGKDTPRVGNSAPFPVTPVPSGLFPTAPFGPNDFVHIHVGNEKQWRRFAEVIGRPELLEDERLQSPEGRAANQDELDAITMAWAGARGKVEAMETLGAHGVPAAALRTTGEVVADADLLRRGVFATVHHPDFGDIPIPSWPVKMSGTAITVAPAPRHGEHTDEVLAEWLGDARGEASVA